jgi:cyclophilin family peptidyl-prolyl cis-trans isomerase
LRVELKVGSRVAWRGRCAALVVFGGLIFGGACIPDRRAILLNPAHRLWHERAPVLFRATIETTKGAVVVEVHRAWAPLGADRFYNLARAGFFDDSRFFRVLPNYIAQFGIPGDPAVTSVWKDRSFPDDSVRQGNVRGTIAFAMTGPNTRTTQLYISRRDNTQLDTQGFAPIGLVAEGMSVVDALYDGYGESAGGGVRAGKQQRMLAEGNAHLDKDFPLLDRLVRVTIR